MNPRSPKYPVAGSLLDINACLFVVTMEVGIQGSIVSHFLLHMVQAPALSSMRFVLGSPLAWKDG